MDHANRIRGPRLPLEDRRLGSALRAHGSEGIRVQGAIQASPRLLVARTRREPHRSQLHGESTERQRHHPRARPVHPLPVWPLLQREQVRRRGRYLRVPRTCEEVLPHRRIAPCGSRLQHGRCGLLAVRGSLPHAVVRERSRRGLQRDAGFLARLPEGRHEQRPVVREETLAHVQRHRHRGEHLQPADRGLQRRKGLSEAGRRHHGNGDGEGGLEAGSPDRTRRGTQLREGSPPRTEQADR